MTLAELFVAMWDRALSEGVDYIKYLRALVAAEDGVAALFHPDPWGKATGPQIWLYRFAPDSVPTPHDQPDTRGPHVLSDLVTFVHE